MSIKKFTLSNGRWERRKQVLRQVSAEDTGKWEPWHQGWVQICAASLESNLANSEIKDAYSLYPEIPSLCIELAKILAQSRKLHA